MHSTTSSRWQWFDHSHYQSRFKYNVLNVLFIPQKPWATRSTAWPPDSFVLPSLMPLWIPRNKVTPVGKPKNVKKWSANISWPWTTGWFCCFVSYWGPHPILWLHGITLRNEWYMTTRKYSRFPCGNESDEARQGKWWRMNTNEKEEDSLPKTFLVALWRLLRALLEVAKQCSVLAHSHISWDQNPYHWTIQS